MQYTNDEIQERMKKIRAQSQKEHNQALGSARSSPFFIDRLQAPRVSAEAAIPSGIPQDIYDQREKQSRIIEMEQLKEKSALEQSHIVEESKAAEIVQGASKGIVLKHEDNPPLHQEQKQEEVHQVATAFVQEESANRPSHSLNEERVKASSVQTEKPEPEVKKHDEDHYYGDKISPELKDLRKSLDTALTKGKVMTNIEAVKMKFKQ